MRGLYTRLLERHNGAELLIPSRFHDAGPIFKGRARIVPLERFQPDWNDQKVLKTL